MNWSDFTDLNSILIKDQFFWNVDTSIVDKSEYNKVFICTLGKKTVCKNVNDFGPAEGESFVGKFAFDFEVAVNQELKDKNFGDIEFSTYQPTDLKKKALYEELEYLKWAKFMIAIRSYINSKICNGIMTLNLLVSMPNLLVNLIYFRERRFYICINVDSIKTRLLLMSKICGNATLYFFN